jgi:hypothetical protein
MFVAAKWPDGWDVGDLALLGVWLAGIATLVVLPLAWAFFTPGRRRRTLAIASIASLAVAVVGTALRWYVPAEWAAPKGHTHATPLAVAFAFLVFGVTIAWVIVLNARQSSRLHWHVTDPKDQGGAVAGYLATYLLPLLSLNAVGWNSVVAYGIYLLTIYVIFVRSDNLVLVNPTLYMLGFRIFDVELAPPDPLPSRRVLLLSRTPITADDEVDVLSLGDECYLVGRPAEEEAA